MIALLVGGVVLALLGGLSMLLLGWVAENYGPADDGEGPL